MSIPVDQYFIITPSSNVQNMPGAYATLGVTDLFFYITETGSLRVVNMNSTGSTAAPGLISYSIAQGVLWMDVITMPGNGVVQIYYTDTSGAMWYAPYVTLGSNVTFTQVSSVTTAITFSTIYAPNSSPRVFLMMIDDGIRHNLYVSTNPQYIGILSHTVTYNNNLSTLIYLTRPSIAMHPSDTTAITVTFQQTVLQTSASNVGFYEVLVPGLT